MKSLARDGDKEPYTTGRAAGAGGAALVAGAGGSDADSAVVEAMKGTVGQGYDSLGFPRPTRPGPAGNARDADTGNQPTQETNSRDP
jgi:hypothetical protein